MVAAAFHMAGLLIFFVMAKIGWAMAHDSVGAYRRFGRWMMLPRKWAIPFITIVGWLWTLVFGLGVVGAACLIPIDIYRTIARH